MAGDYTRNWKIYGASIVDVTLPSNVSPLITARAANRMITVQRITFTPSVWSGTTLSFVDSLTGIEIGHLDIPPSNPTLAGDTNMLYIDYGPTGTKLSPGANLLLGGGGTGRLHIEAYQKGPLSGIGVPA